MYKDIGYEKARDIMLELVHPVSAESVPLSKAYRRILAGDVTASADVPPFNRSPFDGYAFRTRDTAGASWESPVVLKILEEVPAGCCPSIPVTPGTATKILTGSPIPEGADGVIKYEATEFTDKTVKLFEPVTRHDIVGKGEDIKAGALLAKKGSQIDPALAGTLAAQGIARPLVYRRPKIGIISTGNELAEVEERLTGGKIHNTNRYMLAGAVLLAGAEPIILGTARDTAEELLELLEKGLEICDMVISTGGASVGDYDAAPKAVVLSGAETIVRGIDMKPGGACVYGIKDGKAIFGLSGNPAAAAVNFYSVCLPCIRKLAGLGEYMLRTTTVTLAEDLHKKSPRTRLIRGRLDLSGGQALMRFSGQGNAMLHAMVGCDVLAEIPAASPALKAGTKLKAYLI